MSALPDCPECRSPCAHEDRGPLVRAECGHEWLPFAAGGEAGGPVVTEAHGNIPSDGATVTVIRGRKVRGSSAVVTVGARVKNVRLVAGDRDSIAG